MQGPSINSALIMGMQTMEILLVLMTPKAWCYLPYSTRCLVYLSTTWSWLNNMNDFNSLTEFLAKNPAAAHHTISLLMYAVMESLAPGKTKNG